MMMPATWPLLTPAALIWMTTPPPQAPWCPTASAVSYFSYHPHPDLMMIICDPDPHIIG